MSLTVFHKLYQGTIVVTNFPSKIVLCVYIVIVIIIIIMHVHVSNAVDG